MESVAKNTGKIESLYQNQMIKNMLERVYVKNKNVLSDEDLKNIEAKFLDLSIDYNQRLNELTVIHSYTGEEIKKYFSPRLVEPIVEQSSLENPKVLVKTPSKPFGSN